MQQFYWVSQKVHSGFSIASYRKKAEWHFWPTQNFQVFVWRKEKHESEKVYAPLCSLQHYYNSQNMEMIDMSKMDKDATHTHTHTHTRAHATEEWKWSSSVVSDSLQPRGLCLPGSSLHGILQARILQWGATSFSRGSSQPRDRTLVSRIAGRRFNLWATRQQKSRQP